MRFCEFNNGNTNFWRLVMTKTTQQTVRWAELSYDVHESVETGRTTALEELNTARIEFLRSVMRSAGQTLSKE